MKSTDDRKLFTTLIGADAASGDIVVIPATQTTPGDGTASIADGFPAETFISTSAGGKRPRGQDVNGFLNLLSDAARVLQAENFGPYSSALSAAIGGYPLNAVVSAGTAGAFWVSTVEDNTTVPGNPGANWQSLFAGLAPLAANNTWTGSNAFDVGPTVPTPAAATNNTQVANTAWTTSNFAALNGSASQPFSVSNLIAATGVFNNIQAFTSSGTFTVPAGVTKARVRVWGAAGGAGAGGGSAGPTSGGGGGGGGYTEGVFTVVPGSQYTVTVGAGGLYGIGGGPKGGTGGTSSFGSLASATGGTGGENAPSGAQGGAAGTPGVGTGGTLNFSGNTPSAGLTNYVGSAGGGSFGSSNTFQTQNDGAGGNFPGGGGGGGVGSGSSGSGAPGLVIVEW